MSEHLVRLRTELKAKQARLDAAHKRARKQEAAAHDAYLDVVRALRRADPDYDRLCARADEFDVDDESPQSKAAWAALDACERRSRATPEVRRLKKLYDAALSALRATCADDDEDGDDDEEA